MNTLIIWLGLLCFCYISPSFSKSVRYPQPPQPPPCDLQHSTKDVCISGSCTCGWCIPEDKHQIKKGYSPTGNCFVYVNNPEYIKKKCGSVNSVVHTHVNSKMCHREHIFMIVLFGIGFFIILIGCIIGCLLAVIIAIYGCCIKCRGRDSPDNTLNAL